MSAGNPLSKAPGPGNAADRLERSTLSAANGVITMKRKLLAAAVAAMLVAPAVAQADTPVPNGVIMTNGRALAHTGALAGILLYFVAKNEACVAKPGCKPAPQKNLVWTDSSGHPIKTAAGNLRAQ